MLASCSQQYSEPVSAFGMPSDFSVLVAYPTGSPKSQQIELIRFRPLKKGHKKRSALLHIFCMPPVPPSSYCGVFIYSNMTPRTLKKGHFQSYSNFARISLTVGTPTDGIIKIFSIFVDTSTLYGTFGHEPDRPIPFHVWSANNTYMTEQESNTADNCRLYGGRAVTFNYKHEVIVYDFIAPRGRAPGRDAESTRPSEGPATRTLIRGPSLVTPDDSQAPNHWASFPSGTKPFRKLTRALGYELRGVCPEIDDERIVTRKVRDDGPLG